MISTTHIAMTTAEAIVAATFILAVAALLLLVVWQLFALARRGMDERHGSDRHHHDTPGRSRGLDSEEQDR
ncbi:MAG TPA: hypothetical protein VK860_12985 [Ilumatobacteraceae bacterium]|nr:hypothetical protein [Ilumatobacteraceae bacterium]